MKKMHLICNSHIDPAWLWRWNEGLAETLSTFRVAADFCEQYDGFVFNHNESLLYEWVEEHEPELFERIKKLVKCGKWAIMGGWYLQPDCVMLSGESFLSQIELGHEYFLEKFGAKPTTAINFDPFGHSRGLVQILKKSGYDSYMFMRPHKKYPRDFIWEGYDGSRIKAHSIFDGYGGGASKVFVWTDNLCKDDGIDVGSCHWGVGNHGGMPSRQALESINEFIKNKTDCTVLHSTSEAYIAEVDEDKLEVFSESLIPTMVGCYTSVVRIKQANRRLENKIALTEKAMSYANMLCGAEYDGEELKKAKKALAFCQFHDILPGSHIKKVEEDSLCTMGYGEEIADRLYNKAFFKLCEGQKKGNHGEIPIMIFNPHPYEVEGEFEMGFMLQNQNWNRAQSTVGKVYDKDGNFLPTQNEKPDCTFNLDWPRKISFKARLAPSSVSRFDCKLEAIEGERWPTYNTDTDFVEVRNDRMHAIINKKTGLIEKYEVDGKSYLKNGGVIEVYRDYEDPWGMYVDSFKNYEGSFELMSDAEASEFRGYPDDIHPCVTVIEDGDVRCVVQAIFKYKRNAAVVEYSLPKHSSYIDIKVRIFSNESNKMIKYRFDTAFAGTPYGETAFGEEALFNDEKESVYHKWCGIRGEDKSLYVINNGVYGGSFTDKSIKLSLLRTPSYATHPINDWQIAPHDRYLDHVDMGERVFNFRITADDNISRAAQVFNEAPQVLSFFPSGNGEKKGTAVRVDNEKIILSSVRKKNGKFVLTLYNSSSDPQTATVELTAIGKSIAVALKGFELTTVEI
ncbi:MAG: alpha-mannosidase [Clostridia bacterium]|nr:alpha-mannosidase [Clostridia bacterium]